ncbi:GNAT family N-acetyltransferase [Sorangium sp. So ce1389]|uniref:GNAT family N-acetyltransferase n=1 Tax=Sorangium sp. So ce1389 TaxID=3133336 RepID=UPI003F5D8D98
MTTELTQVISFRRLLQDRASTRLERFPGGTALFNDEFRLSFSHNRLRLEEAGDEVRTEELAAVCDELLGAAGHAHRSITIEDERTGLRLAPDFVTMGWVARRDLVMVHRALPAGRAGAQLVRELDWSTVRPLVEETVRRLKHGMRAEVVRQLVDRNLLVRRAARLRHFGVIMDGRVVSSCDLYEGGEVAQIEEVATLEEYRGRGHARAVVRAAVEAAQQSAHRIIFINAIADDWPKEMYRRLGFEAISSVHELTRLPRG